MASRRDRTPQRWQCSFPPGAWLRDRAWPGAGRAGGHVRGDPRTQVSGRRCPLPGGAVGTAARPPAYCARGLRRPTPRRSSAFPRSPTALPGAASPHLGPRLAAPPSRAARSHPPASYPFCLSKPRRGRRPRQLSVDDTEAPGRQRETWGTCIP